MTQPLEEVFLPGFEMLAPDPFVKSLERVRKIYEDIGAVLGVDRQKNLEERKISRKNAPDAYEEWEHRIFDDWEEDLEECEKLRGQFAIVFLARALQRLADEVKRELGLDVEKERDGFLKWFPAALGTRQINVSAQPEWACIEDVVNGRHTIMHREARRKSRYLDSSGEAQLAPRDFDDLLDKLGKFCGWLRSEVKAHRSGGAR